MLWIIAASLLLLSGAGTIHLLGRHLARKFAYPAVRTQEETLSLNIGSGDFSEDCFSGLPFNPFSLQSKFGYSLEGAYIRSSVHPPAGAVILCHGHRSTWHGMIKYMPIFTDLGFTIIAYNHRYHGTSGGSSCSAGWYEKQDLASVAEWVRHTFSEASCFGLMGESMGAAAVMQYMPMDEHIDFVVADCPYSSMADIYIHQLSRHNIPGVLHRPIIRQAQKYLQLKEGFPLQEVSPEKSILQSPVPLLIIHGKEDSYVPPWMSVRMHEFRKDLFPTELFLVPGSTHANSWTQDHEAYKARVTEFVTSVISPKHQ